MRRSVPKASARRAPKVAYGSRMLRGGRVTKWKGEAASCAPHVAQVVLAAVRAWSLPLVSVVALTGVSAPAWAQDRHWDPNGATAGSGGTGIWNLTNPFWSTNGDGQTGAYTAWDNGPLYNAIFGGTPGTVTLITGMSVGDLIFNVPSYTLSGGSLTFGDLTPTITLAGGGGVTTINSALIGSNGLTINGGSTGRNLTLRGANTGLTGGLTLNSGLLVAAAANSLGATGNAVTVNSGAVLQVNHSSAFGGDTAAANLTLNNGAILYLGDANLAHDVTLTGGTVYIQDPYLSGIGSTWTGSTTLTADTTILVTDTGNNTGFAGNLTDTGGNRLSLVLSEGGGIDSSLYVSGANSFTGGIIVNSGQMVLSGFDSAAALAGNIATINGGILTVSGNAFGGDTDAAQLVINNGGRLRVNTNQNLTHNVTLTGGTAYLDGVGSATWNGIAVLTADTRLAFGVGGNNLTVTGNLSDNGAVLSVSTYADVRLSGNLSFSGDLTIQSGNTWFMGGTHTYTGDTIIADNGRLLLNSATTLSPFSNFRFEGTNPDATTIIYGTTAVPLIDLPNGTGDEELRWAGHGGFYALAGQADVDVNLGGAGATLTWNDGLFVPTGSILILGTNETNSNARELDFQNPIDFNGAVRTVRADNGNINDRAILSGVLSGVGGGLQVIGHGGLELTNANTYTGATVVGDGTSTDGTLILGHVNALPGGVANAGGNSNLQFNGSSGGNDGIVVLTAASGDFLRGLGAGGDQVQWTGSGMFGARGGARTVNIGGAGATLAWGQPFFVQNGQSLNFGGRFADSAVNWVNGLNLGAVDRNIVVNEVSGAGVGVRFNGVIEGTGGIDFTGRGAFELNALNTFSGTPTFGDRGANSDTMNVYINTLTNAGVASSLGMGSVVEMACHACSLVYTGAVATSTDRDLALSGRTGSWIELNNDGAGALNWMGDISVTNPGATNQLILDSDYPAGPAYNEISGLISDGVGTLNLRVLNDSTPWRVTAANTYTGNTEVNSGAVLEVTHLADGGVASSIGQSSADATNLFLYNGTLRYVGAGDSTNRSIRLWTDSTVESSGSGALHFTSTGQLGNGTNGGFTLRLGGTNTDNNSVAFTLTNTGTYVEHTVNYLRIIKQGTGLWALTTDSNAHANAFTHNTEVYGGALRLDHAGAITGGLGTVSSHGAVGSAERSSVVLFGGAAGTGGVLGLTAASGGFSRGLTVEADAWLDNNGTTLTTDPDGAGPLPVLGVAALDDDNYVQGVRWIGSGGFAAWDGIQVVNLFGDGRTVTWNTAGFVPTARELVFGYETADGTVDFQNPISFTNAARTVQVHNGTAAVDAILSGVLTSTTVAGGLTKTGTGTLAVTNANTYAGATIISGGTLQLGTGGATGTLGAAAVTVAGSANIAFDRNNTYVVANQITGPGTLIQQGSGTTTLTSATNSVGDVDINGGVLDVNGVLATPTISMADNTTLNVDGTVQEGPAAAATITGSAGANTVTVTVGATLRADGGLGDGADLLDVAGTFNTGGADFDLGDGADTFTVGDGTSVAGTILGGGGVDTLNSNIAGSATLSAVQSFETLTKSGVGVLNVNGPAVSDFTTVNVNAGTLRVGAGGQIAAPASGTLTTTIATGATLDVGGAFGCGVGADSIAVSGAITGGGTIDQCGGDDLLTLSEGADVSGFTGALTGGGQATWDTVTLDPTTVLTLAAGAVLDYERLVKVNTGTGILNGAHTYSAGVALNGGILDVNGALQAPTLSMEDGATLNVDGSAEAAGGSQIAVTGSGGANTIIVTAGATLRASGDLGDGADLVDVGGLLDIGGGSLLLGDGDDTLTVRDNTTILGLVGAGAGNDTLNTNIAGVSNLGAAQDFETLTKTGVGLLNITGPATSSFVTVNVLQGTLNVNATAIVDPNDTTVASGATMTVDGAYLGTADADTFTVAGTVNGSGTIDLLGGDDLLTLQDGADLTGLVNPFDGGAHTAGDTLLADIAGSASLNAVTNFEFLIKSGAGVLNVAGPAASDFASVDVQAGTLDIGAAASITGAQTTTVGSGATLNIDGAYAGTAGADTLTLAGTLTGAGAGVTLGAGDDVLTLQDGATLGLLVDAGGHAVGDTVILDNANALTFNGANAANFELLVKQNVGTATMTGAQTFSGGTTITAGALDVDGTLETPTIAMADDTALNVDGTVQASGPAAAAITGSSGVNTVTVGAGGLLFATGDLGLGADVLDVAGTLDIGGGVFLLGDGDDVFTVHDGTVVLGTVDGGAGDDTRIYNIDLSADLGALVNFEGLTKTGLGVLNINGPGASNLADVQVLGGTLNVGAAGSVIDAQSTLVASGATLQVDGAYAGTSGADTFTLAGTLTGSGAGVALGDGDDVFTLQDGATLDLLVDGGGHLAGDTIVLDNVLALAFDSANAANFESLLKQNTGTATLTGIHFYSTGTTIAAGVLDVDGLLETPTITMGDDATLNVDGLVWGLGGSTTAVIGSAGVNTVTVGASGMLFADGDLGDGADVLDVVGTLDTGGGVFLLGDGDDDFAVHDGTIVLGTIDGGAGLDTRVYNINLTADLGALLNFEGLTKTGTGVLNVLGPTPSSLAQVEVLGGVLNVNAAGAIIDAQSTLVAAGATLQVDGGYAGTSGADTFTLAGTLTGSGAGVALGDGDDVLTLQDGATLDLLVDGGGHLAGDTVVLDNASAFTVDAANVVNFESLLKQNAGTATLTGVHAYSTGTTIAAGVLDVDGVLETPIVAMGDDTTLNVDGVVQGSAGGQTAVAGSSGANTVTVRAGATLLATGDLGDGDDVLDVAGTLDTGVGTFFLGAGDDTFIVHDTTAVIGALDAGLGNDLLNVNVGFGNIVPLGATTGFETLGKSGLGTLAINGPSDFVDVDIQAGMLDIAAGGSVQAETVTLASGAALNVDGALQFTPGADTFTVAGTVTGLGSIDMLDGNDTLTLLDGADLSGLTTALDGGAGFDLLTVSLTGTATLGGVTNFETLNKDNTGTLNIDGPATADFNVINVNGGVLNVGPAGSLTNVTATTVAAGAEMNVAGAFAGSSGADALTVAGLFTVTGSAGLGAGDDVLDVSGTLDLGGGAFLLGDGDDSLVIHDGTVVLGTVDGGAGQDSRVYDLVGVASVGALQNFEGLTKRNSGTLNITGPAATTDLQEVRVEGGVLNIAAGASVLGISTTVIETGATLNVDGVYRGSSGGDAFTVAGVLQGAGGVDLGDGDDVLTLQDGFDIAALTGLVDGGGHVNGDRVVLDNASAASFGATDVVNFEHLTKQNLGVLTLAGDQAWSSVTLDGGTLQVDALLETATIAMGDNTTLLVDGVVGAAGSGQTVISGGPGASAIVVSAGATLRASGDLGEGADTLDIVGVLDTGMGALLLGGGADTFTIHDGTVVIGTVDGGAGVDTFVTNISTSADLGAVLGFETLTKTGAGVLNINGPGVSAFTAINVDAGTLHVASGGSVGAAPGASLNTIVADGATLDVDGAFGCGDSNDALTIAGVLSGDGAVNQCGGDDVLTLTDSADISGFSGDIDGGAHNAGDTLRLNAASDMTFGAGQVANYEFLVKQNVGAVTLTGAHAFTGGASIEEGMLNLQGTLQTPLLQVLLAGTLAGSGQVMGNLSNAGIIAPGAPGSIGTLTVNGDVAFLASSTLAVDIDATGAGDLLTATGVVTIQGGVVDVTSASGTYAPDTEWTLITAAGGVIGRFDGLIGDLPFVDLTLVYDPNNVYLGAERNDVAFCEIALTRNQCAAAGAAEGTGTGSPIYDAIAGLPDEASARTAFDLMSGEIHASTRGALMEDSRFVREAAAARLRAAHGGVGAAATPVIGYGSQGAEAGRPDTQLAAMWGQIFGSFADTDGDENAAGLDRTIGGVFFGADAAVNETWRVGLIAGYDLRNIDVDARLSTASVDTYHAGLYAGGTFGAYGLRLGAAFAEHDVDTARLIVVPGFAELAESSYGASTTQAFAELGRRFDAGQIALEPFVGIAYVHQDFGRVAETGGDASLSAIGDGQDLTYSTVGLRFERGFAFSADRTAVLRGSVAWRHASEAITPNAQLAFEGGAPFSIEGPALARDTLAIEAGLDMALGARGRLSVGYDGRLGDGVEDHGLTAAFALRF